MVITLVAATILASRNRILVKLALRNIPRRKAQTVLIIVGLMLSTTIIMAALGIGDSINGGIRLGALYSLGGTDIRLTSQVSSRFGDNYLDDSVVDRVRSELDGDQRIDGIMPLVREQMPVVNEETLFHWMSGWPLTSGAVMSVIPPYSKSVPDTCKPYGGV